MVSSSYPYRSFLDIHRLFGECLRWCKPRLWQSRERRLIGVSQMIFGNYIVFFCLLYGVDRHSNAAIIVSSSYSHSLLDIGS